MLATARGILQLAAAACALLFSFPVLAQAPLVEGTIGGLPVFGSGDELRLSFTCSGAPTCTGSYQATVKIPECSNTLSIGGAFSLAGLGLSAPGSFQGTVFLQNFNANDQTQSNGTCIIVGSPGDATFPYTGNWNGTTGTLSMGIINDNNQAVSVPGSFKADISAPPAVFPMVVQARIDANTATASADIQFRPQDVGQSGSVFTFASAPATLVQGGLLAKAVNLGKAAGAKADVACVLAQLSPSGQLVAVTSAQLQAFVTGAFSAQGASVSILNGVPTPRVAGATFYVGYGANGAGMLDGGVFRNAVLVPGNTTCPPLPYMTSLWWNPSESGWGLNLNQQGSLMFGTLFTYDSGRAPLWLVMPAGALQADGVTFTGDLFRTTGSAFNTNPFPPIGPANITQVGTMSVSFAQANSGTLTYTVNGVEVRKNIQRQVYGSRSANCLPSAEGRGGASHYQDLWWNAAESGWGLNITHQDNTFFATLFTYDAAGRDLWLVMPGGARQADGSYLGDLFRTTGSAFNTQPFPPIGASDITAVGNMRLRFTTGNTGTLTYTYDGTTVTKAITRQEFSTPLFACN